MKKLVFVLLFLLANGVANAQWLSAKEIVAIAETAETVFVGGFNNKSKAVKFLQSKGFVGVKWKEKDPDFADAQAPAYSYKYYSKSTNSYLIFHADSHGRLIQEVVYRFKSPVCFAALGKQFKLMTGKETGEENSDYNNSRDFAYSTSQVSIDLRDDVKQVNDKEVHSFSVSIYRDKAVQEMNDEIGKVKG